ncbi:RGCVC family protein [Blastococcus sp. URHD0036]|uniref:RGCVC family protein n=1 Tax=Blastococcus sp. URHD0036 TaxID=1380356 RepID=UPI00054FCE92|nr:RGCVC family protein [Blastococcus sp. URHD0036]
MAHSTFPTSYVSDGAASPTPEVRTDPQDGGACPACPHALDDHDPISLRFCRAAATATAAGGAARGCICRS